MALYIRNGFISLCFSLLQNIFFWEFFWWPPSQLEELRDLNIFHHHSGAWKCGIDPPSCLYHILWESHIILQPKGQNECQMQFDWRSGVVTWCWRSCWHWISTERMFINCSNLNTNDRTVACFVIWNMLKIPYAVLLEPSFEQILVE